MTDSLTSIDVAFSFLAADQAIADRLAGAVRSHIRPFVYSEAQKEIAGKDGASVFTRLYGETSTLVVVLFRHGYGDTKWTRIEEAAITSRGVERGWEGILVVSLDGTKPAWIPASRLWFGLDQFGFESAAEVIIARHRDTGTAPRPETALEKAVAIAGTTEQAREAQSIEHSEAGVALGLAAVGELWRYLDAQSELLNERAATLGARVKTPSRDVRYFDINGARVSFGWSQQFSNTLDGSNLLVRELSWPRTRAYAVDPEWREVSEQLWVPRIHPVSHAAAWQRHRGEKSLLSTHEMAEHYLKRLLERHGGHEG